PTPDPTPEPEPEPEPVCEHAEKTTTTVRLKDVGMCDGAIRFTECKACGAQEVDTNYFAYTCDLGEEFENDATCPVCSTTFNMSNKELKTEDCHEIFESLITVKKGDTVLLNNALVKIEYESHNSEEQPLDLRKYSDCYNYINVDKCKRCDHAYLYDFKIFCNGGVLPEPTNTMIDGINHEITTVDCEDCSLKIVIDKWLTPVGCDSIANTNIKIYDENDTLIYDLSQNERGPSVGHDLESEFILMQGADSCEDGCAFIGRCNKCGIDSATVSYYHPETEDVELDITACEGICNGKIILEQCPVCEKYTDYSLSELDCNLMADYATEIDPITGAEIEIQTHTCEDCDLVVILTRTESTQDCKRRSISTVELRYGDTTLYKNENVYEYDDHNEIYSATLADGATSCEDGIIINISCADCDYTQTTSEKSHLPLNSKVYDLSELEEGLTGVVIVNECACKAETGMLIEEETMAQFSFAGGNEEVVDGVSVTTTTLVSPGEKVKITLVEREYDEGCTSVYVANVTCEANGETIIDDVVAQKDITDSHEKITLKYKFLGDSCSDGMFVFTGCKNCDSYFDVSYIDWHQTQTIYELDADAFDICSSHEFSMVKCPCGKESSMSFDSYNLNYQQTENTETYTCDSCD
ncbi:MAG: hypothetical protein IKA43_04565, partial [Clostridia bacterium]|nr:hypothetical protein [Clostridia bacterium]